MSKHEDPNGFIDEGEVRGLEAMDQEVALYCEAKLLEKLGVEWKNVEHSIKQIRGDIAAREAETLLVAAIESAKALASKGYGDAVFRSFVTSIQLSPDLYTSVPIDASGNIAIYFSDAVREEARPRTCLDKNPLDRRYEKELHTFVDLLVENQWIIPWFKLKDRADVRYVVACLAILAGVPYKTGKTPGAIVEAINKALQAESRRRSDKDAAARAVRGGPAKYDGYPPLGDCDGLFSQ